MFAPTLPDEIIATIIAYAVDKNSLSGPKALEALARVGVGEAPTERYTSGMSRDICEMARFAADCSARNADIRTLKTPYRSTRASADRLSRSFSLMRS